MRVQEGSAVRATACQPPRWSRPRAFNLFGDWQAVRGSGCRGHCLAAAQFVRWDRIDVYAVFVPGFGKAGRRSRNPVGMNFRPPRMRNCARYVGGTKTDPNTNSNSTSKPHRLHSPGTAWRLPSRFFAEPGYWNEGVREDSGCQLAPRLLPARVVGALIVGSGEPLRGSPTWIAASRSSPSLTYSAEISKPR